MNTLRGAAQVHTVPTKVTGKCGSVTVRLIPAPRGAGIVAARVPKKVLQMAGIEDCYTCSRGSTKTLGNFVKARSSLQAVLRVVYGIIGLGSKIAPWKTLLLVDMLCRSTLNVLHVGA